MRVSQEIEITPAKVIINGEPVAVKEKGEKMLVELYRQYANDYPKFFKMDTLCRLGFIASEILLREEQVEAVILANRSASIKNDTDYLATITGENYYPSPALFVYTLPNIVTGEIAIRHHIQGETSFYILQEKDEQMMEKIIEASFADIGTKRVLCGWIDAEDDDHFEAELKTIEI